MTRDGLDKLLQNCLQLSEAVVDCARYKLLFVLSVESPYRKGEEDLGVLHAPIKRYTSGVLDHFPLTVHVNDSLYSYNAALTQP